MTRRRVGSPRDRLLADVTTVLFTVSLGMASVAFPLLTVAVGHEAGAVGALVAVSAVAQTVARLGMGRLMEVFSTRTLVLFAGILLIASNALLVASTELWVFAVAQAVQGASRAYFWSAAQTHVVRGAAASSVGALARMNTAVGAGSLAGPVVAGMIAVFSLPLCFVVAAGIAAVALVPVALLERFPPFERHVEPGRTRARPIWNREGVPIAIVMNSVSGAWYALLVSYVPVVVTESGHSAASAGALVGLAHLASTVGGIAARGASRLPLGVVVALGVTAAGLGISLASLLAAQVVVSGAFLALSGIGAGLLQTVAPALAADSVGEHEQGRAIVTLGTFRSATLLVTPLSVSALLLLGPGVAVATGIAAAAMALPALSGIRRRPGVSAG